MILRLLLLASLSLHAQTLPQDRMRTGMAELSLRAWSLEREEGTTDLASLGVATFLTDNFSLGILATKTFGPGARSVSVNAEGRYHFFPLAHLTPWLEWRAGGLIPLAKTTGATQIGAGFGLRWRPPGPYLDRLCLDLQIAGFERWGYDDPSESTNGTSEWMFQRLPFLPGRFDGGLVRLIPQPSLQILL